MGTERKAEAVGRLQARREVVGPESEVAVRGHVSGCLGVEETQVKAGRRPAPRSGSRLERLDGGRGF